MSVLEALRGSSLLKPIFEIRYERWFATATAFRNYRGVFRTFDEAFRSAPGTMPVGCDRPEYADHHVDRMHGIYPYDYPVLFWLKPLVERGARVFDFGGNVGVHWYAYRRYATYGATTTWTVCEVPTIVKLGSEIAERERAQSLFFSDQFGDADGADVLLAAGALHYVDGPSLGDRLGKLKAPPTHLLLNKLPLREGETFWTLQNARTTFLPCKIFDRAAFLRDLAAAGYDVIDEWLVPGYSCTIPFHPDRSIEAMTGLYARRRTA